MRRTRTGDGRSGRRRLLAVLASVGLAAGLVAVVPATASAETICPDGTIILSGVCPASGGTDVTVEQAAGQADPTSTSPIHFTVTFSEAVTGFTSADPLVTGSAGATTVDVTGSGAAYDVAVSGMTTDGSVTVSIPGNVVTSVAAGESNRSSTSTDNTVTWIAPALPPTVTVEQQGSDPTSLTSINFQVTFSEPVTGLSISDFTVTGSTGGTVNWVEPSRATLYYAQVSGMTTSGTVTVSLPAGATMSLATGLPNQASTSTDNTVTWIATASPCPTVDPTTGAVSPAPSAGVDWSGCDLTGANLVLADLTDADLTRADLTDADLTRADLRGARLTGAGLSGANLFLANLFLANLTEANLTDANLTGTYLAEANLTDADLTRANLTNADLDLADLTRANLTNADLTDADLTRANLTDANFSDANLTGATGCAIYGTPVSLPEGYSIEFRSEEEGFCLTYTPTDTTAPTADPTVAPPANANGWHNSDVTVTWNWGDGEGFDPDWDADPQTCPRSSTITGEGSAVTVTESCTDEAGNTGTDYVTVKVDKTAPTLNPTVSPNPVLLNGAATADAGASDSGSGVASQSCGPVNTSTVGTGSVQCTATDRAGNTTTGTATYRVVYQVSAFSAPVDTNMVNKAKAGQTVPFKFTVSDANGHPVTNLTAVSTKAVAYTCESGLPVDAIEEYVTGGSGLQNFADGSYQYNWKTPKTWRGCRILSLDLGDGVNHTADFQFK